MKHILVIAHSFKNSFVSYAGNFIAEQSEVLHKNGYKISLIAVNMVSIKSIIKEKKIFGKNFDSSHNNLSIKTKHIISIPFCRKLNLFRRNYHLKKLAKKTIFQEGKPDLTHLHVFYSGGAAIWLKNQYKIPYIVTEHFSVFARNLLRKSEENFARKVYENASARIAVSMAFRDLLSDKFQLDFEYIPNLVNLEKFYCKRKKRDKKQLVAVGKLDFNKNHSMLIDALKLLPENICLSIVGDGNMQNSLNKQTKILGLEKRVKFLGSLGNEELPDIYQKSDIFVLPSRYETFGIVLIEAMACGLPVVATRCQGAESIVTDERLGELCDINVEDMSAKILKVINRNYDSNFISNFVKTNFSDDSFFEKISKIIERTMDDKQ
ncbi:MAG: glycosyltransferase family 4 protein [Bacteroidales bacterium]|nr:glycosyltransferase family 4 protein [Bacteroidales bacterium]